MKLRELLIYSPWKDASFRRDGEGDVLRPWRIPPKKKKKKKIRFPLRRNSLALMTPDI